MRISFLIFGLWVALCALAIHARSDYGSDELYEAADLLVVLVLAYVIYFFPTMVASIFRNLERRIENGIALLNLLLGATGVGWVGALVWAVAAPPREDRSRHQFWQPVQRDAPVTSLIQTPKHPQDDSSNRDDIN